MKLNIPWIESPFFEHELQQSNLSDPDKAIVQKFADEGFIIIDPGIDESVIDKVCDFIKATEVDAAMPEELRNRIQDGWKTNEYVRQIATAPRVLDILELLYQRKPIPFQTLNFMNGTQQRTHSDMIHFSSLPERFMCGVWVALEDVHDDNGPLHYYPQSHKMKFFDMLDVGIKASDSKNMKNVYMDYSDYYEQMIEDIIQVRQLKKETLNVKKGQALVWAANLLHGGERINKPGSTRLSQVNHYYFENCIYYTPLFSDPGIKKMDIRKITDINTGRLVENKYFDEVVRENVYGKYLNSVPKPVRSVIRKVMGAFK